MGRTSTTVKDRWNKNNYDNVTIRLPKGCKAAVEVHAQGKGLSVNGLVNTLLRVDMGLTETEWRKSEDAE